MIKSKAILSALMAAGLMCSQAQAYNFPDPNWTALYYERESMVKTSEFELYAEGSPESAPFYYAKFEPRAGAYIGMNSDEAVEQYKPVASYLTYLDSLSRSDFWYPTNKYLTTDNVVVTVGYRFDMYSFDEGALWNTLNSLTNKYNRPMLIRLAYEMNVLPSGDDPDLYVDVFRRAANVIHQFDNLAVVWSPNDIGALNRPFELYYPGDEYVDWIGVSCYMLKYFIGNVNTQYKDTVYFMTGDYAWATNKIKPIIDFMAKRNINKPIMIGESGVETNNRYDGNSAAWGIPRLRNMLYYLVMKYPQIKLINYFNKDMDNEFQTYGISNYPYAAEIFKEARDSGAYIKEYGGQPDFVFNKAKEAGTLTAKNGIVNLYTYAYFANVPELTVTYKIDNVWYHASNTIPYICRMSMDSVADGKHTLTIEANGTSKSYDMYKSGDLVSFGAPIPVTAAPAPAAGGYSGNKITVLVNGREVAFDQPPVIENERTLVPLRAIFEALGAYVSWDGGTQTVTATKGATTISLTIGSEKMIINNSRVAVLDVPAKIISDRTMVPVRAISEAFGCSVDWIGSTQTVVITE